MTKFPGSSSGAHAHECHNKGRPASGANDGRNGDEKGSNRSPKPFLFRVIVTFRDFSFLKVSLLIAVANTREKRSRVSDTLFLLRRALEGRRRASRRALLLYRHLD
jgi:hypothetical protein